MPIPTRDESSEAGGDAGGVEAPSWMETHWRWPWRRALLFGLVLALGGRQLAQQPLVGAPGSPWAWLVLFRTHFERIAVALALGFLAIHPWIFPRGNLSEGPWDPPGRRSPASLDGSESP